MFVCVDLLHSPLTCTCSIITCKASGAAARPFHFASCFFLFSCFVFQVLASGQLGSRSGIGFTAAPASSAHSAGRNKWKKTQARFQEVQQKSDPVDMFANE